MSYIHLTIEERCCIREYYKKGKSYREIARLIGRNVSTISREIKRLLDDKIIIKRENTFFFNEIYFSGSGDKK